MIGLEIDFSCERSTLAGQKYSVIGDLNLTNIAQSKAADSSGCSITFVASTQTLDVKTPR